jgi:hypothetical protein
VTLPPDATRYPAPVLYALEDDGTHTLINYTVRADTTGTTTYVADRTFRRGVLVLAEGGRERQLVIETRSAHPTGRGTGQGRDER